MRPLSKGRYDREEQRDAGIRHLTAIPPLAPSAATEIPHSQPNSKNLVTPIGHLCGLRKSPDAPANKLHEIDTLLMAFAHIKDARMHTIERKEDEQPEQWRKELEEEMAAKRQAEMAAEAARREQEIQERKKKEEELEERKRKMEELEEFEKQRLREERE